MARRDSEMARPSGPSSSRVTASPSGSRLFHELAGAEDKTLKLYEGAAHDLLRDLGKERVMEDIAAWLRARLPADASPAARSTTSPART